MEVKVRLEEWDINLMKRVAELIGVPRVDTEDYIELSEMVNIIDELVDEVEHWQEKYNDLKNDRDDNWKRMTIEEQIS